MNFQTGIARAISRPKGLVLALVAGACLLGVVWLVPSDQYALATILGVAFGALILIMGGQQSLEPWREKLKQRAPSVVPFSDSPVIDLYKDGDLDRHEQFLRQELQIDRKLIADGELATQAAREFFSWPWWQRIRDDELGFYTTSDHKHFKDDIAGPIHTLYGRLSEHEGSLLRPTAKWLYTQPILPDLNGKSVLEIGSSCGFWSFKFLELGASKVTGVETVEKQVNAAREMARRKKVSDRVTFMHCDAFYDPIDQHDVVFYSEVLGHSLVPFHAFLRTLGLARETVIADEFFGWDDNTTGQFYISGDPDRETIWTGFSLSEHVALTLAFLAGINPKKVRRYRNQYFPGQTLMILDLTGAADVRRSRLRHESQRMMMAHALGHRAEAE